MSNRLTFNPDTTNWFIRNFAFIGGHSRSPVPAVIDTCKIRKDSWIKLLLLNMTISNIFLKLTVPFSVGGLPNSILPTTHCSTLVVGSNEHFPWLAITLQFWTGLGIFISNTTSSSILPMLCLGPTVSSSLPAAPFFSTMLCRIYSGIATALKLSVNVDKKFMVNITVLKTRKIKC